ncbi:MAG: hypothetical protein E7639_00655 [Ruminococcaceae bacterium]|nr:hypothetical protein [Oscillospiraceae bacterium]
MKRYRIENGIPILPPCGAVTVDGRVVSNFAGRIARDAVFAAAHGYYPIKEELAPEGSEAELLEGEGEVDVATVTYSLINGAWVRTVK